MKLLDHIKARGLTIPKAAAELEESHHTIHKIAYGQRQPSLPLAVKIAAWSDGAVTEAELLLDAGIVATCGACERSASDPACDSCTRTDCGLRQKEAA